MIFFVVFFFKQKTAYEMRISDWSSDVCSSDLIDRLRARGGDQWRIAPPSNAKSTRIVAVFIARSSLQWLTSPPIRCPGDDMTMRGQIGRASGRERVCQ